MVGIIGVRQSGKSVLLRDLLLPELLRAGRRARYKTLDSITERNRALKSPEAYSEPDLNSLQILDEVQKAPDLFDSIKLHVDQNRHPGMFVMSGSTEFSKLTGIRESLTGRIGILHLYPMTLSELHQKALGGYWVKRVTRTSQIQRILTLDSFEKKINRGGMPGLCFIRDDHEFGASCDMWLETSCFRDLQQVQATALEGELGLSILGEIARSEEPTAASLARTLKKDARLIQKYLKAFEAILVIHRLDPHPAGVGKPIYTLTDVGLASHLGAGRQSLLRTHLLFEGLSAFEAEGWGKPRVYYYRNEKTARIPIIFDWGKKKTAPESIAVQIHDGESPSPGEFLSTEAFARRAQWQGRILLMTQTREAYLEKHIEVCPLRG